MAYFNQTDTSFHPTFSAPYELEAYPFLGQTSAIGEPDVQVHNTLADYWSMADQPRLMVGSPAGLRATASYEPVATTTSYTTQADRYGQQSYFGHYWPAAGQQPQSHHFCSLSWDSSFVSTGATETSTVVPTPSNDPPDCWGTSQSGPSTSTLYTENVQPSYKPSTGPARTGLTPTERFQPYGMFRTRQNKYWNVEAGQSTPMPLPIPYVGPQTPQPSGGISETTADADKDQTITEEGRIPAANRTKRLRGQGPPRPHRMQMQKAASKLCGWVREQKKLQETPSLNRALTVAVGVIQKTRQLEYIEPRLLTGQGKRTAAGSRGADEEFGRRNVERRLFQELSQYYPLEHGQGTWARPSLLSRVLKDLEDQPPLSGPSNETP